MTQEEQLAEIAEAHGYEKRQDGYWRKKGTIGSCGIPEYFNDTDAVIEACNAILTTEAMKACYAFVLTEYVFQGEKGLEHVPSCAPGYPTRLAAEQSYEVINATAAQRATALVAVIRKHIKPEA